MERDDKDSLDSRRESERVREGERGGGREKNIQIRGGVGGRGEDV